MNRFLKIRTWIVCTLLSTSLIWCTGEVQASIIAVVKGGHNEAEHWLARTTNGGLGVTGLLELVLDEFSSQSGLAIDGWDTTAVNDGRSGSWTLETTDYTPEFWLVKFDGLVGIFQYDGPSSSPYSNSYDLNAQVWDNTFKKLKIAIQDKNGNILHHVGEYSHNGVYANGNAKAGTSHLRVWGSENSTFVAVPEPGSLLVWSAIGLCGLAIGPIRRR